VPQEISLEEKKVYLPTPMILELIPPVLVHERAIPTFDVGSSSAAPNVNEALLLGNLKFQMPLLMKNRISPKI
jgi:hypothetical protein